MRDNNDDERVLDAYADQLSLYIGPFGCSINFAVSDPVPDPGVLAGSPVATIRMSLEHLKVMAFLLRRQLLEYERQHDVRVQVPRELLRQMQVGLEDWQSFWE